MNAQMPMASNLNNLNNFGDNNSSDSDNFPSKVKEPETQELDNIIKMMKNTKKSKTNENAIFSAIQNNSELSEDSIRDIKLPKPKRGRPKAAPKKKGKGLNA